MTVLHRTSPVVNDIQDGDGEDVSLLVCMDDEGPRVLIVREDNKRVIANLPLPPCEASILTMAFTRATMRSMSMAEEWDDGLPGDGRLQRLAPVQVGQWTAPPPATRPAALPAPSPVPPAAQHNDTGAYTRPLPAWKGLAHGGHPGYQRRVPA
jgi:hypothetical protein